LQADNGLLGTTRGVVGHPQERRALGNLALFSDAFPEVEGLLQVRDALVELTESVVAAADLTMTKGHTPNLTGLFLHGECRLQHRKRALVKAERDQVIRQAGAGVGAGIGSTELIVEFRRFIEAGGTRFELPEYVVETPEVVLDIRQPHRPMYLLE